MATESVSLYRIGEVDVDPSNACIRRNGENFYLRQKAFRVLLYLLEHPDRVVTKEELLDSVWDKTAVVEDALVQCISDLRRALGDDPRQPRFVRTIPKIGYRLIVPINKVAGDDKPAFEEVRSVEVEYIDEEIVLAPKPARTLQRRRGLFFATATVVFVIVVSVGAALHSRGGNAAIPGGKTTVAVAFFENRTRAMDAEWLREGIPDMLITQLSRADGLSLMSRHQMRELLQRSKADAISLPAALEVARRGGAQRLIAGTFTKVGERIRIDAQLHDIESGRLIGGASVVAQPDALLSEIDVLTARLTTVLGATVADARPRLADWMTHDLEAYRLYSLGVEAAHAYRNPEAIALFEKAIARDPEFAMAHARIGYAWTVTSGQPAMGKPYLEKAFRLSGRLTPRDRLHVAAWYALANFDYATAIDHYRAILAQHPYETEASMRLAALLQGENRLDDAAAVLQRALAIDPDSPDLHNRIGGVESSRGRHKEAIAHRLRYVELRPDEANPYDSLALSESWAGDYEKALAHYQRALELNPRFEPAVIHLANLYFQLGRYRDSIRELTRFINLGPSDSDRARGWESIAFVHWRQGRRDLAEQAVARARAIQPRRMGTLILLHLDRGDVDAAARLLQQCDEVSWSMRGSRRSDRWEEHLRALHALRRGDETAAIEHARRAHHRDPPMWDIDAHEEVLGDIYLAVGKVDEAIEDYERVIRLNPNHALAHYKLGLALQRVGRTTASREHLERFLSIWSRADEDVPELIAARRMLAQQVASQPSTAGVLLRATETR